MLIILKPHCCAKALQSSRRAMSPFGSSGLVISHNRPAGGKPANLQRSVESMERQTCFFPHQDGWLTGRSLGMTSSS